MLVITRKIGQRLVMKVPPSAVKRFIEVEVVAIRNDEKMQLGIDAERDIEVMRKEILTPSGECND